MPISGAIGRVGSHVAAYAKNLFFPQTEPASPTAERDEWGRWEVRRLRYGFYWAFWNQSVYDNERLWSGALKQLHGLYWATRCNYSPMYRLGEFWATTVWGGKLSTQKWGGRIVQSAIPIDTDNDAVRDAIGLLWVDSRWQQEKTIACRYGAVKGDIGLRIYDDLDKGKVRICPVNPDTVKWVRQDRDGEVTAYEIVEPRWDPEFDPRTARPTDAIDGGPRMVLYRERCWVEDGRTHFQTFRGDDPYPWNGVASSWTVDYGFCPLEWGPHIQMHPGYFFGASELQNGIYKAMELDDVSSKQHDHIRVASHPKWVITGASDPRKKLTAPDTEPTRDNPRPGSQESPTIWIPTVGATLNPMVFNVDNQFVSIEIQNQLASFEKDYPELRYDSARASGDASAKALREVRKSAEAKVHDRRTNYDALLERAQAKALAIGGKRKYEGYPFSLEQYRDGGLRHVIGERSVFLMDPLDRTEEEQALATAWQTFKLAGWPDKQIIDRLGDFSDQDKAGWLQDKLDETALALQQQLLLKTAGPAPAPAQK
jgi:hypothetical protein